MVFKKDGSWSSLDKHISENVQNEIEQTEADRAWWRARESACQT